ncbi:MAG: alpha-D-ribose 1-methylphosphonate 5-triphosphate diphosphatase [Candidatus Gastranaerophilales bacterium]|nr:alpha-D-ribose 1-methylphosphonate 5-triphosphate diphosphatase [Clostridia bacterium]MBQ4645990.1 alpha-D-ribose 1-methylphosphonate 5-triphosphate diphosphatase [Candidatus Gastranaerophilales bacterium]
MLSNSKIVLKNGLIITENEILNGYSIFIEDGIIKKIFPNQSPFYIDADEFDCKNNYIMPGLIDIHSDVIEKVIVPRKGTIFSNVIAINEIDKQLAYQGITTILHSISFAATTICNNQRTLTLENMFNLCDLIHEQKQNLLINHQFHARLELNTCSIYEKLLLYISEGKFQELSLMDHTPGQGQYRNLDAYRKVIYSQYGKISDEQAEQIIEICKTKPKLDENQLNTLMSIAKENNIPIAYHDVEYKSQIDMMVEKGIKICEFPLNCEVASYASKNNIFSVVGSPNIVLGRSHNNNISAKELIANKHANIICSDYFSTTLLISVFVLFNEKICTLPEAVKLATINPAKAIGIDEKYGSISEGKIADIIIVNNDDEIPKVRATFIKGKLKALINI